MKTIYLEVESKSIKKSKQYSRNHLWFDVNEGKMKTIKGGYLRFKYNIEEERMVPYAEDLNIISYEKQSNKEDIMSWIKNNNDKVSLNMEESFVGVIAIDVEDEDSILNLLDMQGFRYR